MYVDAKTILIVQHLSHTLNLTNIFLVDSCKILGNNEKILFFGQDISFYTLKNFFVKNPFWMDLLLNYLLLLEKNHIFGSFKSKM